MVKNSIIIAAAAVILMMMAFHADIANGQVWRCNSGYLNCNNGFCCPVAYPICAATGKCCPLAYPIYYNNRCYRWAGRSIANDSKVDAVEAAHKLA